MITWALGGVRSVVNVGTGAGSYEPAQMGVIAVDPSIEMIRQSQRRVVTQVKACEAVALEPTSDAEEAWVTKITAPSPMSGYLDVCTPGYYNAEGKHDGQGFLEAQYPEGPVAFYEMLEQWRKQGELEGLIVK